MKNGMIVCGFPGIGKTSICNTIERYVDLESSTFNLTDHTEDTKPEKMENWEQFYCQIAYDLAFQGKIVFVSSHQAIRDRLFNMKNKSNFHKMIPILIVYPDLAIKDNWLERLERRYWISFNCGWPDVYKNKAAWDACKLHYEDFVNELNVIDLQKDCPETENVYRIILKNTVYKLEDEISSFITTYDTINTGEYALAIARDRIANYKSSPVSTASEEDK